MPPPIDMSYNTFTRRQWNAKNYAQRRRAIAGQVKQSNGVRNYINFLVNFEEALFGHMVGQVNVDSTIIINRERFKYELKSEKLMELVDIKTLQTMLEMQGSTKDDLRKNG